MTESRFAELDALSTEELRKRAFALARRRGDIRFFWDLIRELPSAHDIEQLNGDLGSVASAIDEAVDLWREFTGHDYGAEEPLIRATFIEYLDKHGNDRS